MCISRLKTITFCAEFRFSLPFGETKALFGVAGSGKSTILKLALGLMRPDSGRITVLGNEVTQMREQDLFRMRGQLGMVFQESALFDSLTVRENVAYRLMEEHGIYDDEIERACARRCASSNWNTRSICFRRNSPEACGAASPSLAPSSRNPELLLYDSPTGGLDPVTSNTIVELIMKQRDVYQHQFPARHAPPARRLHHGHASVRSQDESDACPAARPILRRSHELPDSCAMAR